MAPPAATTTPRAGRNLPAAIGVGLGLGGLVLLSLFVTRGAFAALVTLAMLVAVRELHGALAVRGIGLPLPPTLAGVVGMLAGAWYAGPGALLLGLALTAVAVVAWCACTAARLGAGAGRDAAAGLLAALYVPFLAGSSVLMLRPEDGAWRVLAFVVVTVCSDVGGYAVGVLTGRHAMAPTISPKKSWEGAAGSLVACVAGGALVVVLALGGSWLAGVALGAAVVVSATLGDLAESMLKRDLGIKDMGSLLPGHGGIMDRLDSLLLTAPVAWGVLTLLVPVGGG